MLITVARLIIVYVFLTSYNVLTILYICFSIQSCRNVLDIDGVTCVSECPVDAYADVNAECQPCMGQCLEFSQETYVAEELESVPVGAVLVMVSVSDLRATGRPVQFEITAGNVHRLFDINRQSGVVTLNASLDFEMQSLYRLTVAAFDVGSNPISTQSASTTVEIIVLDVNDNPPVFSQDVYTESVMENNEIGALIATVVATDVDSEPFSMITYSLIGGDENFVLDNVTGELSALVSFDYEVQQRYSLDVLAIDSGAPFMSASAQVVITVINQNDVRPTFNETTYFVEVSELFPVDVEIVQLQATDIDGSSITYSVIGGNEEGRFTINRMTGAVSLASSLDYEMTQVYTLMVAASDGVAGQVPSGTATVLIEVLDENDNAPEFMNDSYVATVAENNAPLTVAVRVVATDIDTGNNSFIDYAITGADVSTTSPFVVDSDGSILVHDILDRENRSSYNFVVLAADRGDPPLSTSVQVTILVSDENDNPPIFVVPIISVNVSESSPVGSDVATFQANDADLGSNARVMYDIVGGSVTPFAINATTGVVSLRGQLDFEVDPAYTFDIVAYDQGVPVSLTSTATLEVVVADVNDNPPLFSEDEYFAAVPENLSIGASILQIQASDDDSGINAIVTYEVLAGNQQNIFRMNSQSGLITLENVVDFEQESEYTLTVSAANTEAAVPLVSTVNVRISITEVNENAPTFSESIYRGTVLENQPPGVTIITIMATDTDSGTSGEISYQLVTENLQNLFDVTADGSVVTLSSFDREQTERFELTVSAVDLGTPPLSSSAVVQVTIVDVNDRPPTFSITDPYVASLAENAVPGTVIITTPPLEASDADGDGPNSEITFQIVDGDVNGIFSIDHLTGQLQSIGAVDFEITNRFELTIEATDNGSPTLSGNATVIVNVEDQNDNPPQILNVPMQLTFTEGQDVLLVSENITVVDADSLPIERIIISLSSSSLQPDEIGSISLGTPPTSVSDDGLTLEYSGSRTPEDVITLLSTLTFENTDPEPDSVSRLISVTISDGDFDARFTTEILIKLVNDNEPLIDLDTDSAENGSSVTFTEEGSPILITRGVSITDGDRGAVGLEYVRIELLDGQDGAFEGLLLSQVPALNVEYSPDNHSIVLSASESSNFASFESALSSVLYFNEADEPQEPLTRVIHVTAFDGDLLSTPVIATVTIILINDPPLLILGGTGDYLVEFVEDEGPVLLTSDSQFQLSDSDSQQLQNATIVLLDVPDANNESIQFDTQIPNTLVVTSTPHTILVEGPATPADFATVFRAVNYNNVLQNPTTSTRRVEFSVSDGSAETIAATLIFFSATNDPPLLDLNGPDLGSDFRVSFVEESNPVVITSGQLTLQDVDSSFIQSTVVQLSTNPDGTSESLQLSQSPIDPSLRITTSEGFIQIDGQASSSTYAALLRSVHYANSADEPSAGVREIYFVVSDGFANSTVVVSRVDVVLVNDPPILTLNGGGRYSTVYEEEALSVRIVDPGNPVAIQDSDNTNLTSLMVTLSGAVDGETAESISSNDQSLEFMVSRTQTQSGIVFNFTFSPEESTFANFRQLLSSLTYRNTLNEPSAGVRNITFTVFDGIDLSLPQTSSVRVDLLNDNLPMFQQTIYQAQVRENAVGILVTTVQATDADSDMGPFAPQGVVEYTFISGNEARSFSIDRLSGEIRVVVPKDRELGVTNPVLTVQASNPVPSSTSAAFPTAFVFITVQDENDNVPQFTEVNYSFRVVEHSSVGTAIGVVIATDADVGNNAQIDYLLSGGNSVFEIDRQTGSIVVVDSARLDREVTATYALSVTAMDRGSPATSNTTLVVVEVTDINDNIPSFSMSSYVRTISEFETVDSPVLTVSAIDLDIGSNGEVVYSLQNTSTFSINASSGIISLALPLDREVQPFHSFIVAVFDGGAPSLSSTSQVAITISDENDNPPVFQQTSYSSSVTEASAPGSVVLSVVAVDDDSGQNANITYSIIGSAVPFEVDPELGTVLTVSSLDRESSEFYLFEIVAQDGGNPPMLSAVSVNITVTDINDNVPTFSQASYTAAVTENALIGTVITTVEASDEDAIDNAVIEYSLASPTDQFTINPMTGEVFTADAIDREERDIHRLVVVASDSGEPPLSSEVSLAIMVLDINDNEPTFESDLYEFSVLENLAPSVLGVLVASDMDQGNNSRLSYSITQSDAAVVPFGVSSSTGGLSTLMELDRENMPFYNFTVVATDNGNPLLSSSIVVLVTVLDSNDNPPEFSQDLYSVAVLESIAPGMSLISVNATDPDLGSNAAVRFDLVLEDPAGLFSLSPHSGELVLLESLDAETVSSYYLTIEAQDGGSPTLASNATIEVLVLDVNDNPVQMTLSSIAITYTEEEPPVYIAPDIVVSDDDVTDLIANATVELLTSNPCCEDQLVLPDHLVRAPEVFFSSGNQMLTISGPTNSSTVTEILRFLQYVNTLSEPESNSLSAHITVSDGMFVDSLEVTISVVSVNDNAPVVSLNGSNSNSSVEFVENSPGVVVAALSQISDDDSGPQTLSHMTVALLSPQDGEFLTAQSSNLVSVLPPSGGVSLLLNGPASLLDFNAVLSGVQYNNLEDNPQSPLQRLIQVVANDSQLVSDPSYAIVTIVPLNDPPYLQLSNEVDFNTTFTERGAAVLLASSDILISDPDSPSLMSVSVQIIDVVDVGSEHILLPDGSLPSRPMLQRVSQSEIRFLGPAPISDFVSVLRLISYLNNASSPSPGPRVVQFVVSDGDLAATAQTEVQVEVINDAPVVDLNGPLSPGVNYQTSFTEEGPAIALVPSAVTLLDSDNAMLSSLSVRIVAPGNRLVERLTLTALSDSISSNFDVDSSILLLSGEATISEYERVLQSVQYENSADEPSGLQRQIQVIASDGELESLPAVVTVTFVYVNDPPLIGGGDYSTVYLEGEAPTAVVNQREARITDADSPTLAYLFVEISNVLDDTEVLNYTDSVGNLLVTEVLDTGMQAISYNFSYPLLMPVSTFNNLLLSLTYQNLAPEPDASMTRIVTIHVSDGQRISESVVSRITIRLIDDNQPVFLQRDYTFAIQEGAGLGGLVGAVEAEDADVGDTFLYRIVSGDDVPFSINGSTGVIEVSGVLDRELEASYIVQVELTRPAPPFSAFDDQASVLIEITDVNDNAPIFNVSSFDLEVREDEDLNITLYVFEASDTDEGRNAQLQYSLSDTAVFDIDPVTGDLSLIEQLDREAVPSYEFTVFVRDNGQPSLSSSASVAVTVLDANDQVPQFLQQAYSAQVVETAPIGTTLLQLSARDNDTGPNAALSFVLTPSTTQFAVNMSTGIISVSGNLAPGLYNFTAVVSDDGVPQLSSFVPTTIEVISFDSTLPMFSQPVYEGSVIENSISGVSILEINATDPLTAGPVSYAILASPSSVAFHLDSVSGLLTVSGSTPLDRESNDLYQLQVSATSADLQRVGVAQVVIRISDANDFPPVFSQSSYTFQVMENVAVGSLVGTVLAEDLVDIGSNAAISDYFTSDSNFSVGSSGVITTLVELDREMLDTYSFQVFAIDAGSPSQSGSALVVVTVLDQNDLAPVFSRDVYEGQVAEGQPPGAAILSVSATDGDLGSNAQVTFSTNSSEFTVNRQSGLISSLIEFDFENDPEVVYEVVVMASDAGIPSFTSMSVALIRIVNIDDSPSQFSMNVYSASIQEGRQTSSLIRVMATDSDSGPNNPISYSIAAGNPNMYFSINSSGIISVQQPLDRESSAQHTLTVAASNLDAFGTTLTGTATVVVDVLDVNDNAPQFLDLPYIFMVSEGSDGGEILGIITATDADTGSNANVTDFAITDGDPEGVFELNSQSGILRLAPSTTSPLDRESIDSYELIVSVSDGGVPVLSADVNVTIVVTDVNDIPPEFDQDVSYVAGIRENASIGTVFFDADASDGDLGSNAHISYSLSEPNSLFAIDAATGEVYLAAAGLDFESQQVYNITLTAVDGGILQLTGSVTLEVNVLDADDQPVQFTLSQFFASVFEDASFGTSVLRVTAQDPDTVHDNPITYSLEEPGSTDTGELPFSIDSLSGSISVIRQLDRETMSEYSFSVFATNTPGQRASATVTIEVLDVNDVAPMFSRGPFNFQVQESVPVGTVLGELIAVDADAGSAGSVVYSLVDATENFFINASTGELAVVESLDYETTQMHSFTVIAIDRGSPPLSGSSTVTVDVQDINDNPPMFVLESNVTFVAEDVTIGTVVFLAVAEDRDSGSNAVFSYSLATPSSLFSIDPSTGEVNITSALAVQTYVLTLVVTDMGTPQLSSAVAIEVVVTDTNEQPMFLQPTYSATLSESSTVGTVVTQVMAVDPDSGMNAQIQYSVIPEQTFTIEPDTGRVLLSQPLDYELIQSYTVTLRAVDSGSPPLTAAAQLTVEVTDVNDNRPVFLEDMYTATVAEDLSSSVDDIVLFVNASDADSLSNAAITYSFVSGNDEGLFSINSLSGAIFPIRELDYETTERVDLIVAARDGGQPTMTGTTAVSILITDVDDNGPIFEDDVYDVVVAESLPVGRTVATVQANDSDSELNSVVRYALVNASDLPFTIDDETGAIFLSSPGLDRELVDLFVFAVEAFNPFSATFTSTAVVMVEVLDVNDNAPMFDQQTVQFFTSEATPVGSVIGAVSALDRDLSSNAVITFSLEPASEFISINSETGELIIIRRLDFETLPQLDLTVVATDSGVPQLSTSAIVVLTLQDSNDVPPQISASPSQFTFREGSIPIRIGNGIAITDPDTFPLERATINLYGDSSSIPAPANDFIQLDRAFSESQGVQLSASSQFISIMGNASVSTYTRILSRLEYGNTADEPSTGSRTVQLQVFDGVSFSNAASISIAIQLENDNPPSLDLSSSTDGLGFLTTFTEGGTFVFVVDSDVSLVDVDGGNIHNISINITNSIDGPLERLSALSFGRVRVEVADDAMILVGPASPGEFELALQTVTYENLVDEPSNPQLARTIEFIASDGDFFSEPAVTTVLIQPVNDPPVIRLGPGAQDIIRTYSEDLESLQLVPDRPTLSDSDSEFLSFINITVVNSQPGIDQLFFFIDSNVTEASNITGEFISGTLLLSGPAAVSEFIPVIQTVNYVNTFVASDQLDQLQGGKTIEFSASDGMLSSEIASVFVTFTEVNDPPFLDLNGPLLGTDFTTSFEEGSAAVLAVSTELTLVDVDSELLQFATVQLSGVLDTSMEVLFTNTTAGGIAADFNAGSLTFTFTGPATAAAFQSSLRSIFYQNGAAEPSAGERTLTFVVSDGESSSGPVTSTVTVVNFNDPPDLSLVPSGLSFIEGGSPVSLVAPNTVLLSDGDSETLASLEVILDNALDGVANEMVSVSSSQEGLSVSTRPVGLSISFIFSYTPSTLGTVERFAALVADLTYSNIADEPQVGRRNINITISDGVDVSEPIVLDVDIQLVNDNRPMFDDDFVTVSLLENASVGTIVYQSVASDVDADSQITYSLINGSSVFNVSFTEGTVVLIDTLDREMNGEYVVYIEASDGLDSDILQLTVSIGDVNDNSPVFTSTLYSVSVSESVAVGSQVVQVLAHDRDAGTNAQVRYTISGGNQARIFTINENTGVITLSGSLDFETAEVYNLIVTAQDFGSPSLSSSAFAVITVTDENDNPPIFMPDSDVVEWDEDIPIGTLLYPARATDIDGNMQLVYSIFGNQSRLFSVSTATGDVILEGNLDFEEATSHTIFIVASDGVFNASLELTIIVLDVNDNPPVFVQSMYNISVAENVTIGEDLLTELQPLQVVDLDGSSNPAVQFFIESGDDQNQFAVNLISSDTAELIVAAGLDREVVDQYSLVIVAQDSVNLNFSSTALVTILILDVNDNPPQFDMSLYNFSVRENSISGTSVGFTVATDIDIDMNGHVTYAITSGDPNGNFVISSEGEIQTSSQIIDREIVSLFTLVVRAEDGGTPSLTTTATVLVMVLDVNDNPPIFSQPDYATTLLENSPPGTAISGVAIVAEDNRDIGENAEVVYTVHPDNASSFGIDPFSGLLTALVSFDYETDSTVLEIIVIATDSAEEPLSAQALVTIVLVDVNEFPPQFSADQYSVQIAEDVSPLSSVLMIIAEDNDTDTGAFITYSLLESDSSPPFAIDNETGIVFVTESLDRESSSGSYQFTVIASNPLGMPMLSSSAAVAVTVLDINDNAPLFEQDNYVAAITTSFEVGNTLLTVSADDNDQGLNGTVRYSLVNPSERFAIATSTGVITSTQLFDTTGVFTLTVVASDEGTPPLSSNATVTINIVQPVDVRFTQDGAGFLLQQGASSTLQQRFGLFVNSPPGSIGTITGSLGEVTVEATYLTGLPQAVNLRGVVLDAEAWHDQREVSVLVQVMDELGDVHCSPVQVVIRALPDATLQGLANISPQVNLLGLNA